MTQLEIWIATPLAGAVGWTLLHSLWQGALLAAALAAVMIATRSPRIRYAAACAAMLLALGAFGITLLRMMPESIHNAPAATRPPFPAWNVAPNSDFPAAMNIAAIVPWFTPFWIAGVWIFYLRQSAAWVAICRMRRRGLCCPPECWQTEMDRLRARLRISRAVQLLESCVADVPVVMGHFRPLILIPVGLLAGLPAEQVEAILLHELAHIRRCDYLVNVLERAVEGLLFYHPAIWWISRVIRMERENCCDDVVVATNGNPQEYALALAALEQNRWSGCEPAVAATGGSLVKRIRRLLYPKGPSASWTPLFAALALLVTATFALTALHASPAQENAVAKIQAEPAVPYTRWLDDDVVYIITYLERAAYLKLTTDPERDHFIEQFWERRNPTPGAAENEFKKEHYRRIVFANQHYGAIATPGWKTDRGHMYIAYGPPDEIDAYPMGTEKSLPFEVWTYRHVEGVGDNLSITFVDRTGHNDYRISPGNSH